MMTGLLSMNDLKKHLKRKLKNGYVLFLGSPDAIAAIEQEIYSPGTPENRLFELYIIPPPTFRGIFLGKKTEALRKRLGNSPDFDQTIAIVFSGDTVERDSGVVGYAAQQIYHRGNIDRAIDQLFDNDEGESDG